MREKVNSILESKIAKSIVKNSVKTSGFICLALYEFGAITFEAFFPPNYSFTKPWRRLFSMYNYEKPNRRNVGENLKRLIEYGLVEKEGNFLKLTEYGKLIIKPAMQKRQIIRRKWDGKYRLVIFDIPEIRKKARAWLREELYLLNYTPLQKSVFIGKYPLTPDIVEKIKKLNLRNFVNYLLVDRVFDEKKLKFL